MASSKEIGTLPMENALFCKLVQFLKALTENVPFQMDSTFLYLVIRPQCSLIKREEYCEMYIMCYNRSLINVFSLAAILVSLCTRNRGLDMCTLKTGQ